MPLRGPLRTAWIRPGARNRQPQLRAQKIFVKTLWCTGWACRLDRLLKRGELCLDPGERRYRTWSAGDGRKGRPNVSQVKTKATDGYDAVQIGFGDISAKHVNKPMAGHFKAAGVEPMRYLREVRVENGEEHKTGDVVTVADFADVKSVDVIGTSKGKGFQGTIKRWNFSRGPMTHGSRNQRRPGSIGQCAYPARVRKGLHMYGHMGDERVTVKNLKLVRIDAEQNLMLVKGAVPGGKNALVQVRMA